MEIFLTDVRGTKNMTTMLSHMSVACLILIVKQPYFLHFFILFIFHFIWTRSLVT